MTIDLIANPRARQFARDPALLGKLSQIAGERVTIHVTDGQPTLASTTARIAKRRSEAILIAGGDGTLMTTLTALYEAHVAAGTALPPICPIPAGTAGTIARNWGIVGSPTRCLKRFLSRPRRSVRHPTLRCEDETGRTRIGFIFGTGLVANFFRIYYERGAPGYQGAAKLVAQIFVESFFGGPLARQVLTPLPCALQVEGRLKAPQAWSLICCSVVSDLGIHLLVNHRAGVDHRRPHLVASPLLPRQLGPRAPRVFLGRPIGGRGGIDELAGEFSVSFPNDEPGPYVLDGELLAGKRIVVGAGPVITLTIPT